jgi:hypothetical protein
MTLKSIDQIAADWITKSNKQVERIPRSHDKYQPVNDVLVAIGASAVSIKLKRGVKDLDLGPLQGEALDDFAAALRGEMKPTGWPVVIDLRIQLDQWDPVKIDGIGLSGMILRGLKKSEESFEDLVEAADLISSMCRPSNRPVKAWSSISNLCGSDFVSMMEIHARTEAEYVLKKLHNMNGVQCLRDYAAGADLPDAEWLTGIRFIASEIEDLENDPMGRAPTGMDALDDIRHTISMRDDGFQYVKSYDDDIEPS